MLPMILLSPPFGNRNPYQPILNPAVSITTLFTLHKHMAPHGRAPPIQTYPQRYIHGVITTVVTPISSSIPDTPNSSWYYEQLMERQDMLWRSWYYPKRGHTNKSIFGSNNIVLHNKYCWCVKPFLKVQTKLLQIQVTSLVSLLVGIRKSWCFIW